MALAPIAELNEAPEASLPRLLAPLFEDVGILGGPIAAGRPYASWTAVVDAAEAVIAALDDAGRAELLGAHPRIGTSPDELARRSALSHAEQGAADTAADTRLAVLNDQYEARFGFPFVVFVAGRPRSALVGVLEERLGRTRAEELHEGTAAMVAIARDRLAKLTAEDTT